MQKRYQMRSNNKKDQILQAALKVVEENGANHLTIDAVAAFANFSKGGVLYHFPTKKALLSGMVEHLILANEKRMDALDPVSYTHLTLPTNREV